VKKHVFPVNIAETASASPHRILANHHPLLLQQSKKLTHNIVVCHFSRKILKRADIKDNRRIIMQCYQRITENQWKDGSRREH
jgi:predicted FMN-binding regulatory protein PaiB